MKKITLSLLITAFVSLPCVLYADFDHDIHEHVPFVSHINDPAYGPDYWLSMSINNDAVADVREKFESEHPELVLKNRADSHITVITPPEYKNILKPYLSPQAVDDIAEAAQIQDSHFTVLCIGRGDATQNNQKLQTYFLVVQSPDLIRIRKNIFDAYVKNGGDPSRFDPQSFLPHITMAFTQRDLFESDGVFKHENSCIEKWNNSSK